MAADDTDILIVTDAGYGKRTKLERFNRQARGGQGVRGIRLTGKRGSVVAAFMIALDEEILLVSSGGVVIRTEAREIASQGRDATGRAGDEPRRRASRWPRWRGWRPKPRRTEAGRTRPGDCGGGQKSLIEVSGQIRRSTLPTMSDLEIGPQ